MITVSLPMPPSVNHIWKAVGKRRFLDKAYVAWRNQCNMLLVAGGQLRGHQMIDSAFSANIIINRAQRRGDLDNRIKCCLDFCTQAGIIKDDRYCEHIDIRYDDIISGCQLTIRRLGE